MVNTKKENTKYNEKDVNASTTKTNNLGMNTENKPTSKKFYAIIYSINGEKQDIVPINPAEKTFRYSKVMGNNDRDYLITFDDVIYFTQKSRIPFIKDKVYLFYYINNPNPLKLAGKNNIEPTHINPIEFSYLMQTQLVKQNNAQALYTDLLNKLDTQTLMVIGGGILVLLYILTGGQIM